MRVIIFVVVLLVFVGLYMRGCPVEKEQVPPSGAKVIEPPKIEPVKSLKRKEKKGILNRFRSREQRLRFFWTKLHEQKGMLTKPDMLAIEKLFFRYGIEREHTQILVDLRSARRMIFESKQDTSNGMSRMIAAWERIKLIHKKAYRFKKLFWDQLLLQVGTTLRHAIHTKRQTEYQQTLAEIE